MVFLSMNAAAEGFVDMIVAVVVFVGMVAKSVARRIWDRVSCVTPCVVSCVSCVPCVVKFTKPKYRRYFFYALEFCLTRRRYVASDNLQSSVDQLSDKNVHSFKCVFYPYNCTPPTHTHSHTQSRYSSGLNPQLGSPLDDKNSLS